MTQLLAHLRVASVKERDGETNVVRQDGVERVDTRVAVERTEVRIAGTQPEDALVEPQDGSDPDRRSRRPLHRRRMCWRSAAGQACHGHRGLEDRAGYRSNRSRALRQLSRNRTAPLFGVWSSIPPIRTEPPQGCSVAPPERRPRNRCPRSSATRTPASDPQRRESASTTRPLARPPAPQRAQPSTNPAARSILWAVDRVVLQAHLSEI